ncbi:MAG TPA: lipid-transfer protein [Casimicrobiaceae bacterium]|nr:lipid-transfer protein [Casimicrobiaceae bacterium]
MAAVVAGTGMVPFRKPGSAPPYDELARDAVVAALADAGLAYEDVQQAYAGFVYGDSTSGQRALYAVGMTGVPIVNVNNNCSTGSTALFLARQAVAGGAADCVLAVGFEQMKPGAIGAVFGDRPSPFQRFDDVCNALVADAGDIPLALRYFGGAGREHMQRYGTKLATFAKVRAKASRHAEHNPNAIFRKVVSPEEVLADVPVWPGVMTRMMACPPTCGAAAAIVVSEAFARRRGLRADVRIRAQAMTTDTPSTFASHSMLRLVGYDMARAAADRVFEDAGVAPDDVDVCELHDCFAHNELVSYEALRLCPEGGAERFVDDGDNTYGGQVVTNPSGGLLSKGHPLGATGLAQCHELVQQLRGACGPRQVEGARIALQHNLGLGGACVVTLYERT